MDPLNKLAALAPTRQAFSLLDEFKTFAFKGNVIDLAVGVIIGTAFAKLIDSLVKNIFMPVLGIFLPTDQSYTTWHWNIFGREIPFGLFLGEVVNFVIIAFALFLFIVKFLGWILRLRKQEAKMPPPLTLEQELLTEIRDLLRREIIQPPAPVPPANPAPPGR